MFVPHAQERKTPVTNLKKKRKGDYIKYEGEKIIHRLIRTGKGSSTGAEERKKKKKGLGSAVQEVRLSRGEDKPCSLSGSRGRELLSAGKKRGIAQCL